MTVHQFGTFEAKNKLSHLLDLVEAGDEVIITRNGKPVAQLVKSPISDETDEEKRARARKAVEDLRELKKSVKPLGDLSVRDLVNEGRRY
ncbi:MAG: type II toxin-antitoxin system prevent-host-death family antitoxin [Pseudomonadota bacterium]